MDEILQRYGYCKFLKLKVKLERQSGPLATKEIENSEILWAKTIQTKIQDTPQFKDDTEKLNLQVDGPIESTFASVLQVTTQSIFHQIH